MKLKHLQILIVLDMMVFFGLAMIQVIANNIMGAVITMIFINSLGAVYLLDRIQSILEKKK